MLKLTRFQKNRRAITVLLYIVLSLIALVMITPGVYICLTSLKSQTEIFDLQPASLPSSLRLENFTNPLINKGFLRYLLNSILVGTIVTSSHLFFCSLAGYGFAKFKFKGQNAIFLFILATMMIPVTIAAFPMFLVVRQFGWLNSYLSLTIPRAMSAFGIFLIRQFIITVPDDYIDAGRIEGCSEFGIYWKIVLPLIKTPLAALAIFTFVANWNEFYWPLITINDDALKTFPVGLLTLKTQYYTLYNEAMAVSLIAMIPVLVLFLLMGRQLIRGVVMSGLKG